MPGYGKDGYLSSISIWEAGVKWKRKKLHFGGLHLREYVKRIQAIDCVTILPVTEAIWMEGILLDWDHADSADRVIVATARLHSVPILTKDQVIFSYYDRTVW